MNYCKTCKYRNPKGLCTMEKLAEDYGFSEDERQDMLIYSFTESGGFWVGPKFGCVHHESV